MKKLVLGAVVLLSLGFAAGFWTDRIMFPTYQMIPLRSSSARNGISHTTETGIVINTRTGQVVSTISFSGKQEWFTYSCNQYEVFR